MRPIQHILMATDFSASADEALLEAVYIAQRFDADVTLLHVFQIPIYAILPDAPIIAGPMAVNQLMDEIDAKLRKLMAGVATVHVKSKIVEGSPAIEILREGSDGNYDLIVMGTHGRTGIRRALIGSVAEQVVRSAHCPVWTTHAAESTQHVPEQAPSPGA